MKFYVLSARRSEAGSAFKAGKSVCVYFETDDKRVLYGLGGNEAIFENAVRFGLNLAEVDTLVLPSARDFTCGSLRRFIKTNTRAKIYGRASVWERYYKKGFMGLSPCGITKFRDLCEDRFVSVDNAMALDTSVLLFSTPPSDVSFGRYYRLCSSTVDGVPADMKIADDYSHELNVAVVTNSGCLIFTERAHAGLKGLLHGAAVWRMQPVYGVLGSLDIFNRTESPAISVLKKELPPLKPYESVRLYLDFLNRKSVRELKKTFSHVSSISVGDVLEIF